MYFEYLGSCKKKVAKTCPSHQQANSIIIDIFNSIQILETHNYNSDFNRDRDSSIGRWYNTSWRDISPAHIIISIKKCNQLFLYRNVVTEMSPDREVS